MAPFIVSLGDFITFPGHQGHDSKNSELKEGDEVSETDNEGGHDTSDPGGNTDQSHPGVTHRCRKYFATVDVYDGETGGKAQFAKESQGLDDSRSEGGQELDTQTSQASSNHGYRESGPPTSHAQQPVGEHVGGDLHSPTQCSGRVEVS